MIYRFADFELDTDRARFSHLGAEIHLYPQDRAVLERLLAADGRVVLDRDLEDQLYDSFHSATGLSVICSRLRKKFRDCGLTVNLIERVTETGYKFVGRVEELDVDPPDRCPPSVPDPSNARPGLTPVGDEPSACRHKLPAAQVIDDEFVESIRSGRQFSREQFFSAKQDEDCQWFGIINNFDVARAEYPQIRALAESAFDHRSISKVSLLVHGPGGIGKSTLLRRLAIDLARSHRATVVWVDDLKLDDFVRRSLDVIEADRESNYFVFVEDWYRQLSVADPMTADGLLKRCQTIQNIRLLIGDREIYGKAYLQHRSNASNQFELNPSENEAILNEIYRGRPEDSPVRQLLKNDAIFRSSLFIVLYVIAGLERGIDIDFEFQDAENAACQIAAHDLKRISIISPGFAKALHYWAAISTAGQSVAGRPIITWGSFLKLADLFGLGVGNPRAFTSWDQSSDVLEILKLYMNLGEPTGTESFVDRRVRFNHDTIAERVISRAGLAGWQSPDDNLKRQILDFAVQTFDDYSVSTLLRALVRSSRTIFNGDVRLLSYIDKLFIRGNREPHYLSCLTDRTISVSEMRSYLDILWEENVDPDIVWFNYFSRAAPEDTQRAAEMILSDRSRLQNMSPVIFVRALEACRDDEIRESAVVSILERSDLHAVPDSTLTAALGCRVSNRPKEIYKKLRAVKEAAAETILRRYKLDGFGPTAFVAAAKMQGNDEVKRRSSLQILRENALDADPHVLTVAFAQLRGDFGSDAVKTSLQAAFEILKQEDLPDFPQEVIVSALLQSGPRLINLRASGTPLTFNNIAAARRDDRFEELKSDAAGRILQALCESELRERGADLSPNIIDQIFKVPGNESLKCRFATKLLAEADPGKIPHVVVRHLFRHSTPQSQIDFAAKVTEAAGWFDDLTLSPPLIVGIARTASTNEDLKERVLIHLGIMNQLSEGLDPRRSFLYHGLLAIPFVGNADWQSALERTVANWQTLDRRGINAILGSGYFGPADLKKICTRILEDWENELQQPLARWFAPPNRGGHVQRALGHPELAKLASITARQIHDRLEGGPGFGPNIRIPDFIKYTVNAILFENDFNHWTPDDHEPQGK